MSNAKVVKTFDVKTATQAQVKAQSLKVIAAYNTSAKAFVEHFIGLCERFTTIDSHSGLVLANFLACLDKNPRIRNGVIEKLLQFSEGNMTITQDGEKWKVNQVKNRFNKFAWNSKVDNFRRSGAESLLAGKADKKAPAEVTESDKVAKIFDKLKKDIEAAAKADKANLIAALKQTLEALETEQPQSEAPAEPSGSATQEAITNRLTEMANNGELAEVLAE